MALVLDAMPHPSSSATPGSRPISAYLAASASLSTELAMRSMPAYGKIPTSDGVRPLNKPRAPSALSTPAITVAIEMFPPAVSATRVLTISSGYTTVCAAAPAIPPAAKRSSTVALPGSDANADFKASNATYLVAVSGTTLATLAAFPRQNAAHPPSLHTARAALASVTRGMLCGEDAADADTAGADGAIPELGNRPACMMVLILSIGAVAVRETAPATPPLASFFAVPMVSPLPPPSPSVAFAASSPASSSPAAASSSSPPPPIVRMCALRDVRRPVSMSLGMVMNPSGSSTKALCAKASNTASGLAPCGRSMSVDSNSSKERRPSLSRSMRLNAARSCSSEILRPARSTPRLSSLESICPSPSASTSRKTCLMLARRLSQNASNSDADTFLSLFASSSPSMDLSWSSDTAIPRRRRPSSTSL
mmetsp:Transcript_14551/g.59409  ORF Transcript_14551/g.59409 Transcript_14551/m.59409 type:complete len:424 (-) Transcript_14551:124-1395(-)